MNFKTLAIAALAAAALGSPAAAATIFQAHDFAALGSGAVTAFSFDQFNASLGTLNSVTLEFTFAMPEVFGTLKNTGKNSRTFTVQGNASAALTGNGFNLAAASQPITRLVTLASGATGAVGPFSGSGSSSATQTDALSGFVGDGDVFFNFSRATAFSLTPSGQGALTMAPTTIGGMAFLTYDYRPAPQPVAWTLINSGAVPEPATWALMITGFGGVGAMLRRRRAAFATA